MHAIRVIVFETEADVPHALPFLTETLPDALPQLQVIVAVPWPDVIVTPAGTVHVGVTPAMAVVEKVRPT